MRSDPEKNSDPAAELPDEWWYRVYAGVIISLVMVIASLWAFSWYFSN